jgi:hypothetical protein
MSLVLQSSGGGQITIQEPTTASNFTQDLPAVTGNVVIDSATQTLTNKTLTSPTITGAVVSTMNSSVITSGTAVASTSGTSIDFTSIPSWVKRVTVMFNGVSTSGTSNILIQIGSGSVTTSGYSSSATFATSSLVSATSIAGLLVTGNLAGGSETNGNIMLCLQSSNTWVNSGTVSIVPSTGTQFCGGVSPTLGGALDRVRITTVNGTDTFDAGSINILYE